MSTFQELQQRLTLSKFKRTVLNHIIEYLDENFRPIAGQEPRQRLLTDERIAVPPEVFESVITDILMQTSSELDGEIRQILEATMAVVAPQQQQQQERRNRAQRAVPAPVPGAAPAPVQAAPAPVPQPAPVQQPVPQPRRRRTRGNT